MSLTCKQLPLPDQALLYGNLIARLTDAAVFLIAEDGRILSWNPGVERILGYKEEQWLRESVHIIFTPEDRALEGDLTNEVERALAPLSDREKEVLRLRYGLGADREYTLEEIGKRLQVTRERVRQIESRALQKLRATKQREAAAMLSRRPA